MAQVDGLLGAVLVARDGAVVLEAAGGPADVPAGTPSTPRTRFQIASVSKQFTACAAQLLAEEGRLALNDPVGRWLDGFPAPWRAEVTLHHLLTHTSGIGHWNDLFDADIRHPPSLEEFNATLAHARLRTPPGSNWHYSSPAYVVAAQMIERAAGMPYARLLAERIFEPLGMTSTQVGSRPAADAARGYRDGEPAHTIDDLTTMAGAGDAWSTVGDMATYATALGAGRLLTRESLRAMHTQHARLDEATSPDGLVTGHAYGYGTTLGTIAGYRAYFHSGDNPGYRSFHGWLPDQRVSVTVLSNDEGTDAGAVGARLVDTALNG